MKSFFAGLILGIILCGLIGWFAVVPGVKQAAYDSGHDEGNKKGIVTGITTGIAEAQAEYKRVSDSAVAQQQAQEEARKTKPKPRKVEKPIQNWRVIGGKIEDPIIE